MLLVWVFENEGSLLLESKQFGPWLKATPFVSNQKYVVKVPGFFARKKAKALKEKLETVKNKPVVVVRTSKQAPEMCRLEKENFEFPNVGNTDPVFQEIQKHDLKFAIKKKAIKQAGLGEEK